MVKSLILNLILYKSKEQMNTKFITNQKGQTLYDRFTSLIKHTGDLLQIDKDQFLKISLFVPKYTSQFSILVDEIISHKQSDIHSNTSGLEAKIDQLVYKLYDLSLDEISLIEGNTK